MPSFDAIVIGAGTNGLACAARLAATGRRVIVLEAAARSGGGALSRELLPGYRVPALAHLLNLLDPRVAGGMNLNAHGLSFVTTQLATTALESTGNHLLCEGAAASALSGNVSAAEQRSWGALRHQLRVFSDLFAALRSMTPPRVAIRADTGGWELARIVMRLRLMGKERFRDFLRMILMSVADILEEHPRRRGLGRVRLERRGADHPPGARMSSDPRRHYESPLRQTPFHARTAPANTLNHWGAWAGYTTALSYDDVTMEYTAIRNAASVYDISPMIKYRISGVGAGAYLNRLTLRSASKLPVGTVHYTAAPSKPSSRFVR